MTISYQMGFDPVWYIADLVGRPLGAGYLATYSSLDPTTLNPVFQDSAGMFPYPYVNIPNTSGLQGILIDENGSQGPFFFTVDSANPNNGYFLAAYDTNGILQWTVPFYLPTGTGGGGGGTTVINTSNLIANNLLYQNFGNTASPVGARVTLLAPGAHSGLAVTASNANPDIYFIKSNTTATDQISFSPFTLGSTALTPDVTPPFYVNYMSNAASGEGYKYVQFPITQGVQNLQGQAVTFTLWTRGNSGTTTVTAQFFQFFGDGTGATAPITTPIVTITATPSWTKTVVQTTIPAIVSSPVLGGCGNDGLFLQLAYPVNVSCNIDWAKPGLYFGVVAPNQDYESYDDINAVVNSPRTGQIKMGFDVLGMPLPGYVEMIDGTIGNASSNASILASKTTFPLFNFLWTSVSNTNSPLYNSSGTPISRGVSAVADFTANNAIRLPLAMSRVFGQAGDGSGLTNRALGDTAGSETHTLLQSEMADHSHGTFSGDSNFVYVKPGSASITTGGGGDQLDFHSATGNMSSGGGATPFNIIQPSLFINAYIKL